MEPEGEPIWDPALHVPLRDMTYLIHPAVPPVRIKRIILAAGCRCELCGKEILAADMDVHTIGSPADKGGEITAETERDILVLCPRCHQDLHEHGTGEEEQRVLLSYRKPGVVEEIRKILATRPKRYVPPEVDLETISPDATDLRPH